MSGIHLIVILAFLVVGIRTAYRLIFIVARPIAIMCGGIRRRKRGAP